MCTTVRHSQRNSSRFRLLIFYSMMGLSVITKLKGHSALALNALCLRVTSRAFQESDRTTPGGNRLGLIVGNQALLESNPDFIRTVARVCFTDLIKICSSLLMDIDLNGSVIG